MRTKLGVIVCSLLLITLWWFWPQKVVLSESEYDVALALYRVCNQKSEDGLERVEALLREKDRSGSGSTSLAIQSIMAQAKSGQWEDAAIDCRRVLDDQVEPVAD